MMLETIQAREISIYQLEEKFGLQLETDTDLFSEWLDKLPPLSDAEKQSLERIRSNYFNLNKRRSLSEEAVKMVVLSPLLDLAGFYQPPFEIETETAIEISATDAGILVKGNIDILVLLKRFWVLAIESKSNKFDVTVAVPQALTYMLNSPNTIQPTFGLIVNGREFVFLKLIQRENPQYTRSYTLSIERLEELYQVLSGLKYITQLILESI